MSNEQDKQQAVENLKTWPERIWLQHSADGMPIPKYKDDTDEICWCEDIQHDNDIEYVRADLALQSAPVTPAANAGGQPIAYARADELQKLADPLIAGRGMMLHKEHSDGMVALYDGPTAASAAANAGGQDVDLLPPLGIRNDRDMLNYLAQAFDNEMSVCDVCHYSETTATCDSARFLRDYLAAAPHPTATSAAATPQEPDWTQKQRWYDEGYNDGKELAPRKSAATPAQDERKFDIENWSDVHGGSAETRLKAIIHRADRAQHQGEMQMAVELGEIVKLAMEGMGLLRQEREDIKDHILTGVQDQLRQMDAARAALSQQDSKDAASCEWRFDGDDYCWQTGCGQAWHFPEGGTPAEHHMNFCHHCGKTISAMPPPEEKPADCSDDPTSCPENEGRGCYCADVARQQSDKEQ